METPLGTFADQLLALGDDVVDFRTLLFSGHGWADLNLSRHSMELMAEEVLPRLDEKMR